MTAPIPPTGLPPEVHTAVAALRDWPIAATEKGFGTSTASAPVSAASLGSQRPPLLGERRAPHVRLLRGEPRLVERLAQPRRHPTRIRLHSVTPWAETPWPRFAGLSSTLNWP